MSFPAYEEYKDSGVKWLGLIPTHWGVWKLAHAFTQIGSGGTPKSDKPEYYDGGTIPWVNTGDLDDGPLADCAKKITEKAAEDHSTLKQYPAGSLLFAMYGATIGKLGLLEFPATVNQACCVFSGESPINIKFLFYWFLGLRKRILSLATGGGQPNVSQDILRTLRVACPDDAEQTAIASFLDSETSKIDSLVSEQRRLIELLKEKRQAVISHAVTKGLNPDVKMKPTSDRSVGGNVKEQYSASPEHWRIGKVKNSGEVCVGRQRTPRHEQGDYLRPYLRVANVMDGWIDYSDILTMNFDLSEQERFGLMPGDVLLNEGQSLELVGRPAVYDGPSMEYCFQNTLIRFRVYDECNPEFAYYVFKHFMETGYFALFARQTTNIAHLGGDRFANMPFPLPPLDEQKSIVAKLKAESERFDTLVAQAERAIELLQERRTALISAAVTGKIDVRQFATEAVA